MCSAQNIKQKETQLFTMTFNRIPMRKSNAAKTRKVQFRQIASVVALRRVVMNPLGNEFLLTIYVRHCNVKSCETWPKASLFCRAVQFCLKRKSQFFSLKTRFSISICLGVKGIHFCK